MPLKTHEGKRSKKGQGITPCSGCKPAGQHSYNSEILGGWLPPLMVIVMAATHVMKTFDKQRWMEIRARGHARFVARRGLLYWGVPFGLVVTLGQFIYDIVTHAPTPSVWSMIGSFIFLTLAFGYGMGETEWRRSERAYHDNAA